MGKRAVKRVSKKKVEETIIVRDVIDNVIENEESPKMESEKMQSKNDDVSDNNSGEDFQCGILYKCPGEHRGEFGLCYKYKGYKTPEEKKKLFDEGWSLTIKDAAELAGSDSFMKPKPKKKSRGVNKYKYGTPSK